MGVINQTAVRIVQRVGPAGDYEYFISLCLSCSSIVSLYILCREWNSVLRVNYPGLSWCLSCCRES